MVPLTRKVGLLLEASSMDSTALNSLSACPSLLVDTTFSRALTSFVANLVKLRLRCSMGDMDRLAASVGDTGEEMDRPTESKRVEERRTVMLLDMVLVGGGGAFSLDIFACA